MALCVATALLSLAPSAAFVTGVQGRRAPAPPMRGFLNDLMDKIDGGTDASAKKVDWKEEAYREQQRMLAERRETGGGLSAKRELEIQDRRDAAMGTSGERELKKLQKRGDGSDPLEQWKELRDSGQIKTATKGLERDKGSARMGSEGLFAERVDERLPYIDEGYVADDAVDPMAALGGLFGFGKKKK